MTETYRLDDLGWLQFERLCQGILKAKFGPAVMSWGGRTDRGRDAYCEEPLILTNAEPTPGPIIFRVKFVAGANATGAKSGRALLKAVRAEREEIADRQKSNVWQSPSRYILMTNVPITASLRAEVADVFENVIGHEKVISWGINDISDFLHDIPNLRVAFPQLLGVRDFKAIAHLVVNQMVIERSETARLEAADYVRVFVPTIAYDRALETLLRHSFVVLTGPPEMGKTTIARMLGLAKHSIGWQFVDCSSPQDFFQNLDDSVPQIFVADDAFGSTEYRPDIAQAWGKDLGKVLRRLGNNRWLVWTSRPVPLNLALQKLHLEGPAEFFPKPAQVKVDASDLSIEEKALILYRHCRAVELSASSRSLVKNIAERVVGNKYLTPERIRRLVTERIPEFASRLLHGSLTEQEIEVSIDAEIAEPTKRMKQSFENLNDGHQCLLFAMLDAGKGTVLPASAKSAFMRLYGTETGSTFEQLLEDLIDHFVRLASGDVPNYAVVDGVLTFQPRPKLQWIHPSWRDLVVEHLMNHQSKRAKFLSRCGLDGLRLALSTGGGSSGERSIPFLQSESDWISFQSRIGDIAKCANYELQQNTLRLLSETLRSDDLKANSTNSSRVKNLSFNFLTSLKDNWDSDGKVISKEGLEAFYELSTRINLLVPSPLLQETWNEAWSSFTRLMQNADDASVLRDAIVKLIPLLTIILRNEPRWLVLKNFPADFQSSGEQIIAAASQYDSEQVCLNTSEEYESEAELVGDLANWLDDVASLFPQVANEATDQADRLKGINRFLEKQRDKRIVEEKEEKEIEEHEEAEYWRRYLDEHCEAVGTEAVVHQKETPSLPRPVSSNERLTFSISELFKDL